MVETVTRALAALEVPPVSGSTLTVRGQLVDLHEMLSRMETVIRDRRKSIELAFVRAAADTGADEIRTAHGIVKIKKGQASYAVKAQAMRRELEERVATGEVSGSELELACPVVISYTVNHTKLNALARHRGEEIAEIIERNRERIEPDPLTARPVFPRVKEG